MYKVIGVRFRPVEKIYYFDPLDFKIQPDMFVVAQSVRGLEIGKIVSGIKYCQEEDVALPLTPIERVATAQDELTDAENKELAEKALMQCQEVSKRYIADMKIISALFTLDRSKIIFCFTANGRVDFRQLVRDLAAVFRTRIELRQIGTRDEVKILGGIGPCGRISCCSSFLNEFTPVSIKMVKDQGLSLNPAKTSGLCGRLMCCLKYENESYENLKQLVPDIGQYVDTEFGMGQIVTLDLLGQKFKVGLADSDKIIEYTLDDLVTSVSLEPVPKS